VARNDPYPGGYVTRHYGRPSEDVHVLQVEINRGLYMDERTYRRSSYLPVLARHLAGVVAAIGEAAVALFEGDLPVEQDPRSSALPMPAPGWTPAVRLAAGSTSRYPRFGTAINIDWLSSLSARRMSRTHWTRLSSVTKTSGQTAFINSSLVTSRPPFSKKYFRRSNA
jgi:hypothetical protein